MDNINDIDNTDNIRIMEMIENGIAVKRLSEIPEFQLIDLACKRLAEEAKRKLLKVPANDMVQIIELQCIAKLYGDVLGNIKDSFIQVSKLAFEEAKLRDLINDNTG